jgi:hypothetical protein
VVYANDVVTWELNESTFEKKFQRVVIACKDFLLHNLYCTGIEDLNPYTMRMLARFLLWGRINGISICCSTRLAGLCVSHGTQPIKVKCRFREMCSYKNKPEDKAHGKDKL